jgi:hypothetical protein
MKTTRNVLCALLLLGAAAGAARAATSVSAGVHIGPSGRSSVDLGFFYDDLASYGNWIERPSHGWVWTPREVSTSWRPYRDGHWVWTDEGWTWISDEPYGWATYHYGRWYDDPEIGWSWVPGDQWAPSWVSWQEGADYVGWAPLPPGVNVSVSVGGGYGGYAYGIAPEDYLFVPEREFLAPRLATYFLPGERVLPLFRQTRNYTNYRFNGGRVYNQGLSFERVQRYAGRRVPRYQVADLGANYRTRGARIQGNRVGFFRPQVQRAARIAPPIQRAAARRAVVSAAQFRAAHPNRAVRQERLARQDRQGQQQQFRDPERHQQRAEARGQGPAFNQRQQKAAIQQRQARVDQRQTRVDRKQLQVGRTQQRQAQSVRQQPRALAQRQAQVRQAQVNKRQTRVDQRQTRVDRQQLRVDRSQQRQAQTFRQQQKARPQQRQARVDQRQVRTDRQQVRVDRQQAQASRQQRQAAQQQPRANRGGGGGGPRAQQRQGGGQGGGQGGRRGHGRPPGQ